MDRLKEFVHPVVAAALAALALGAAFAGQAVFQARALGGTPPAFLDALVAQTLPWVTWVPFFPAVQLLAGWIRREEISLPAALGLHGLLSLGVIPAHVFLTVAALSATGIAAEGGLSDGLLGSLVVRAPTGIVSYGLIAVLFHLVVEVRLMRRARQELADQQRERMEVLGRLAGGIAHRFNNILASIQGRASLLEMEATSEEIAADTRAIQRDTGEAAQLTQHLLALGGRRAASMELMDLSDGVRSFLARAPQRAHLPRVGLRFSAPGRRVPVRMDPVLLNELLSELVDNARAASRSGDDVEIRVVTVGSERSWAAIEVEDHGVGMDEETRTSAFAPFFSTRFDDGRGGLGLSAVRGIAEQAGGRVTLESKPGRGTLVRVQLPVARAGAF